MITPGQPQPGPAGPSRRQPPAALPRSPLLPPLLLLLGAVVPFLAPPGAAAAPVYVPPGNVTAVPFTSSSDRMREASIAMVEKWRKLVGCLGCLALSAQQGAAAVRG
jgi:hypothetical protein